MPRISTAGWLLSCVALGVGILGMSAAWVTIAVIADRSCSWLALVAALDMAMLLRLTNAPPGRWRVTIAILATAVTVLLSQWLIVATQLGFSMGLQPLASSLRLGPALAWELGKLSLSPVDWVFLLSSLPLAGILVQDKRHD